MDFNNIQLLKDNSNECNNMQLLKDNSNEHNNNIQLLKDNSNERNNMQCQRTIPMDFNNNFNNNNNAKDNSLDLEKLAQLTMICCSQIFESGKVFCDSIPNVRVKKDPSFCLSPTFCWLLIHK